MLLAILDLALAIHEDFNEAVKAAKEARPEIQAARQQHRRALLEVVEAYEICQFFSEADKNRFREGVLRGWYDSLSVEELVHEMYEEEYTNWSAR